MKEFRAPALKRLFTNSDGVLAFSIPLSLQKYLGDVLKQGKEKNGDWYKVTVTVPGRPRSTGEKSQNHRINGFIQQIAIETGNNFDQLEMYFKQEAISEGWPYDTLPSGAMMPKSEADATVEDAAVLIAVIERFAAEWGIPLQE